MMSAPGSLRREAQLKCELNQTQDETGTVRPPDEDILGGEQPVHGPHEAIGDLGDGERRENGSRVLDEMTDAIVDGGDAKSRMQTAVA